MSGRNSLVDPPEQAADAAPAALEDGAPSPEVQPSRAGRQPVLDRIEAFISRLSTRNNFWHRVCSLFYLPYAFRSGIRMKQVDDTTFAAVLPFKRFNRNWYNAMAGAALLGNAEIAGGMYVFGICGGEYTVVCKRLEYRFLRPCFGPAMYRMMPETDINELIRAGGEFNYAIKMNVVQQLPRADTLPRVREKRVGRVYAEFHVTPKQHLKTKGRWLPGGRRPKEPRNGSGPAT